MWRQKPDVQQASVGVFVWSDMRVGRMSPLVQHDRVADRSGRVTVRRAWTFVLVGTVLLVGLSAFWLMTRHDGGSIDFDTAPSSRLLSRLANDAGLSAYAAGAATRIPVDGTTPDTADREFQIKNGSAGRSALLRACATHGLHAPSADERQMLPEAVCLGRWEGRDATVLLFPRTCTGACRVSLEIRVI